MLRASLRHPATVIQRSLTFFLLHMPLTLMRFCQMSPFKNIIGQAYEADGCLKNAFNSPPELYNLYLSEFHL